MKRCLVAFLVILIPVLEAEGQSRSKLFNKKRKKVEVPNYTLFLNLHDLALEYSAQIESTIDSLLVTDPGAYHDNLFNFRIRSIQSLQHVLYKSDPLISFFDGWIFGEQIVEYLKSPNAQNYLGPFQPVMLELFQEYLLEYPEMVKQLTGREPGEMAGNIITFGQNHPILDPYLNRTSITDAAAPWVGEARIGFKSGVATLTDALRNVSDRLNYYAEYSPKLTQWNVEKSVRSIIGPDSVTHYLERTVSSLEQISKRIDSIDHLVYSITDTLLVDLDRQRWETLGYLSAERKAALDQFGDEREILLEELVEIRLGFELMIQREREAALDEIKNTVLESTEYGFDRIEDIIENLFFKILILTAILSTGIVLAVFLYKRL